MLNEKMFHLKKIDFFFWSQCEKIEKEKAIQNESIKKQKKKKQNLAIQLKGYGFETENSEGVHAADTQTLVSKSESNISILVIIQSRNSVSTNTTSDPCDSSGYQELYCEHRHSSSRITPISEAIKCSLIN